MEYHNTKTGAVIISDSVINGGNWISVAPDSDASEEKKAAAPKKKRVKKNG